MSRRFNFRLDAWYEFEFLWPDYEVGSGDFSEIVILPLHILAMLIGDDSTPIAKTEARVAIPCDDKMWPVDRKFAAGLRSVLSISAQAEAIMDWDKLYGERGQGRFAPKGPKGK